MKIGLFGYGTIGRGVYTLIGQLDKSYNCEITKVFDLPIKKDLLGDKLVTVIDDIVNDDEIGTVVEVLGGHDVPYEVITKCLAKGKSVITANKEVVSQHLEEFISLAHANDCSFCFEASAGGGIPVIRTLIDNIKVNDVNDIYGILNGTTNYILTRMDEDGLSFDEALKLAQKNGFAEANPTADLEGLDIVRKINILSSIAFKGNISNEDIYHYGITGVNKQILESIKELGYALKFVASSKKVGNSAIIRVEPTMVRLNHPFASIKNEFNAVLFTGSTNGDLMFYGKGAGSIPTATAIVSDLVSILEGRSYIGYKNENALEVNKNAGNTYTYYIVGNDGKGKFRERVSDEELLAAKFYARVLD
ncbi:MAG: homoserine dehydrogenase [Acholeplasmatales bacterium]|nr:homoserine dehydrogenase [Acholeplasmatales bacterium]